MHDCKGREIHEGDVVVARDWTRPGKRSAFKVIGLNPNAQSCNLNAVGFETRLAPTSFNANETELILTADGTLPAPV